jgi:HK97 family phage major capsid protein
MDVVRMDDRAAAIAEGTGGTGGYAVPVQIDPSFQIGGSGALCPLRQLATVKQTIGQIYRPITTDGATAYYGAEAADMAAGEPTLDAPPDVYNEIGHSWVRYSFEAGDDIIGFGAELSKLLADARDVLDAVKFVSGAGHASHEPEGLLTGLSGTQEVAALLNTDNVRTLIGDVPARFAPGSVVLSNLATLLRVHALVGGGSDEPPVVELGDHPTVLNRPWHECSTIPNEIMVAGDCRAGFVISDRIGFRVELAPVLIDGTTGRPTGERGMLAWWRSGSKTVVPNAFRFIDGSASG